MKNNKLLAIFLSVLLVSLSGCCTDEVSTSEPKQPARAKITKYIVEGVTIECIEPWSRQISCNWEKYNKLKKAN
jgi:hypothetical protein